jgi:hypothetical protein
VHSELITIVGRLVHPPVIEFDMNVRSRLNQFGIASVALSALFWFYVRLRFGPNAFTQSPHVEFVLWPGILIAAAIAAAVATLRGTKWWLLALLGPLPGAALILSAGA